MRRPRKSRRHEPGNATIATVGEDPPVLLARSLDLRITVVDWIVAVARTARGSRRPRDHGDVPALVRCGSNGSSWTSPRMIPCRNQCVDDPRAAPVTASDVVQECRKHGCHRRDDPMRRGLRDRWTSVPGHGWRTWPKCRLQPTSRSPGRSCCSTCQRRSSACSRIVRFVRNVAHEISTR